MTGAQLRRAWNGATGKEAEVVVPRVLSTGKAVLRAPVGRPAFRRRGSRPAAPCPAKSLPCFPRGWCRARGGGVPGNVCARIERGRALHAIEVCWILYTCSGAAIR